MTYAENQFMEMTRDKEWHNPAKENQENLELTAKIKALKEQFNSRSKGASRNEKQAWKKIEPKPEEAQTKKVGGKTFNWCIHHKAWCMYKLSECCLGMPTANAQPCSVEAVNNNDKATFTLENALAALWMDET